MTILERVTNEVIQYKPQGDGLQNSRQIPEVHSTLEEKFTLTQLDQWSTSLILLIICLHS